MKKQCAPALLVILFSITAIISNAAQESVRSNALSRKEEAPQLGSVQQFKEAFRKDVGKVRLVALVSPT
jgi:hypothetical protein